MDLEDLIARYQEIKFWKRLTVIIILILVPLVYDFWERWEVLVEANKAAYEEKTAMERKLNDALEKHRQVAKLEQNLSDKEQLVKEASKKLPEEVPMDSVLQKTELIAQEVGIEMKSFEPGEQIPSESAFKYFKMPVHLNMSGTYGQIASFLDHITHLDLIVNVENLNLQAVAGEVSDSPNNLLVDSEERKKRSKIKLRFTCDLMIFRSMTQREEETLDVFMESKKKTAVKSGQGAGRQEKE